MSTGGRMTSAERRAVRAARAVALRLVLGRWTTNAQRARLLSRIDALNARLVADLRARTGRGA